MNFPFSAPFLTFSLCHMCCPACRRRQRTGSMFLSCLMAVHMMCMGTAAAAAMSAAATASGGLCILAQTKGVLHHDLSNSALFYFQVYLYIPYSRYSLLSDFLSVKIILSGNCHHFIIQNQGEEIFLPLVFSSSIFITDLF